VQHEASIFPCSITSVYLILVMHFAFVCFMLILFKAEPQLHKPHPGFEPCYPLCSFARMAYSTRFIISEGERVSLAPPSIPVVCWRSWRVTIRNAATITLNAVDKGFLSLATHN